MKRRERCTREIVLGGAETTLYQVSFFEVFFEIDPQGDGRVEGIGGDP